MATVHSVAQVGFGTGTNELYDRIRPRYQPWALEHIKNSLPSSGPYNIVELGSGTGIFTRAILADPAWSSSIKELKAVEPSEGMRSVFEKTVHDERAKTFDGTFDATGVEDGWADLIVVAQAFHWCPDHVLATGKDFQFDTEIEDNLLSRDGARWAAQVRDLIEQHEKGTPQFRLGLWRKFFTTPEYDAAFAKQEEKEWSYNLEATEQIVVDRASSKSYITVLPPKEKAEVQAGIREIVERGDDLEWVDKEKGLFKYPYKTLVVIAKQK
ncbi:hypothetical protein D9611_004730 [Ephemerocybe angulata]|uniref:Methyltransferase type 11 domain-containing protein n=1 Tax=Ephemerocybe angulata TaxID=980116 RepID=A0A8H5EX49_9AGAR|nr:hypothetical protein D9611_004730 [Tulosesus angulatus]